MMTTFIEVRTLWTFHGDTMVPLQKIEWIFTLWKLLADLALQSGVTTLVDAGTAGAETFLQEKEEVIDHAKVRVLAFLNIVANGMNGGLEQSVDQMDPKLCAETIKKYPDIIVGVKTAHFWTEEPWDAEHIP